MSDNHPKEYYEKKPGFVVKSGTKDQILKKSIDYSVTTDNGQGFMYLEDGNYYQQCQQVSYELSGCSKSKPVPDGQPARIIRTETGNIIIEAMSGDVIIRGRNIRIESTDGNGEVTINSSKIINLKSPITNIQSTIANILGSNNVSITGQSVDTVGGIQNARGVLADLLQGFGIGRVISLLTKAQKFLR